MQAIEMQLDYKTLFQLFLNGNWSCGYEKYKGKPMLYVGSLWHDAPMFVIHIGKFWLGCDYLK